MLHFDADSGFYVDEVDDVRTAVADAWKTAFRKAGEPELNTEPETPAGQLIDSHTAAVAEKDAELLYICNQFDPARNSGLFQDAIARIYYLTRKAAVPSQAEITVRGLPGTVIPVAAQIRSTADSTLWAATGAVTIPAGGVTTATFACMTEGAITAPAGALTQIVTVVAGWDSATNTAAASVGNTAENRGQFEARRYQSVAVNSRSVAASVYARILQLPDVISCYVTQNRTNQPVTIDGYTLKPHSIYAAVVGGDDEEIAQALYDTVSAGCDYNGNTSVTVTDPSTGAEEVVSFNRPGELDVYVRVVIANLSDLPATAVSDIKTAIYNNFYGLDESIYLDGEPLQRVTMNTTVYASRFPVSLQNIGISAIERVQVSVDGSTWLDSVRATLNQDPVLLTDNIIVVETL